jgi:hypothetical protein
MGMSGKDIKYKGNSVNHLCVQCLLKIVLLYWRQFIVEDDNVRTGVFLLGDKLFQFALPQVVILGGCMQSLDKIANDFGSSG